MKKLRKLLAVVLSIAMVLGMTNFSFAANEELPDIILDGGEEGGSSMIKLFPAPSKKGKPQDDEYAYLGYVSFLDMVPDGVTIEEGNYRYLVMTYTGNITTLRCEFNRLSDEGQELHGPFWFNPEGQTCYFVTADGSDIPLVGDNTTIVIDLLNSVHDDEELDPGVNIDWYNSGMHMHCGEMVTYGDGKGIDITNAYLTNTIPEVEEPTEPETEEPVVTEPATTPETEPEVDPASDIIVLDDGTDGGFCGLSLSSEKDGYQYGGYVYLKEATADYKYLQLTYTGSLLNTRFEISENGVHWFDTWQTDKFVDVNGNDIDTSYSDEARTIVIDLEKSDVELGWGNDCYIHTENLLSNGGITFIYGCLTKTADVVDVPEQPSEPEDPEDPENPEDPEPELPDEIILDDGDNGGLCGHELTSVEDGYAYGGYVYLKGATADYKYLQLTYTGSLANARFEIINDGVYWFDTWQTDKFVDVDGNDFDTTYSDEERTIVIDLEKSGAELGKGDGMHIHVENLATNGGINFIEGKLLKTAPVILPEVIVLDEGDNSGLVGHELSSTEDGYAYGGYVYLKGATAEYKYLEITYTGSLLNTRFEIINDGVYWFDTWQTDKFVDVDGNDIDTSYSEAERTIVIDLEKSGAELGKGDGMHIHTENLASNGGVNFADGRLYKTYTAPAEPVDMAVSVVLENDLSVNFKVPAADLASYTNPAVVVTMNDKETVLTDCTVVDDMCVFTYTGIDAAQMTDTITAVLTADEGVLSDKEFSLSEYAVKAFDNTEDEELKTLLADMLVYGAAVQAYAGYNTDNLATSALTDAMAAYATSATPSFNSILTTKYEKIANPTVAWKSAGIDLGKNPIVRLRIAAENIEGLTAVITVDSVEYTIPASDFVAADGGYYVYFDKLGADQMSTPIYAKICNGSTAVSNTLRYSVESYLSAVQSNDSINSLAVAMMNYGNSAKAYAAK